MPGLVIFRGEFEPLLGILYGVGDIAKRERAVGSGGGDRSWQRAKLFFIHDNHLSVEFILSAAEGLEMTERIKVK